jgi:predicted nucleic acid-binding protein
MEDEAGAERVAELLRAGQALLPWIALLEAYYVVMQERGVAEADRRYALARALPAEILWDMDEPAVLQAGALKASHRLSLADAIVAALALRHGAVLLHKDPEFEPLAELMSLEGLPYKSAG